MCLYSISCSLLIAGVRFGTRTKKRETLKPFVAGQRVLSFWRCWASEAHCSLHPLRIPVAIRINIILLSHWDGNEKTSAIESNYSVPREGFHLLLRES